MKKFKRIMALVIALAMVLGMTSMAAFADYTDDTNPHSISITSNGNGKHTYNIYQVFKGNLNAAENVLSNIQFGNNVDGDKLITALQGDTTLSTKFPTTDGSGTITYTAASIAKIVSGFNASEMEAFADVVATGTGVLKGSPTETNEAGQGEKATANVTGDGYYLIMDKNAPENGDTKTKFVLQVVNDLDITAKDTVLTPDKEIQSVGTDTVNGKTSDAAIGDTVTFTVTIPVPDTTEYKDNFWFIMNDQLPVGLTFMEVTKVELKKDSATETYNSAKYTVTAKTSPATEYSTYSKPTDAAAAVTATGGQAIKVVFNDFKEYVENADGTKKYDGYDVIITYTAVINDDAAFGVDGNTNTVNFTYSNDPNHDYDGDEPGPDDTNVTGTTPNSTTTNYVTTLKIHKTDESGAALAGATFEVTSTAFNTVLESGEKYEKAPYTAQAGETADSATYYKLVDGSYTTTAPVQNATNVNLDTTDQYATPITDTYVKVKYVKEVKTPTSNKYTVTSDASGNIILEGVKDGEYSIKEIQAPDGYNLLKDTLIIDVDWDGTGLAAATAKEAANRNDAETKLINAGGFKIGANSAEGVTMSTDGKEYSISIKNFAGSTLPSTGGIGTTIFYVVGAILVIGAGVIMITRRRMDA